MSDLESWRSRILLKVEKWKKSVLSRIKLEAYLSQISLEGAEIKESRVKYFGRFRPEGISRVITITKNKVVAGVFIHYPTIWLEGENRGQMLNVDQRFEVYDKGGLFCEGTLGHPFPDLHAKYGRISLIRQGESVYKVRYFPIDAAPEYTLGANRTVKATLVVYDAEEKPLYCSPTIPLAGKEVYDIHGKPKLRFAKVGAGKLLKYILLEGIAKKRVTIGYMDPTFPICLAIFLAQTALIRSYYLMPIETIQPKDQIYAKY